MEKSRFFEGVVVGAFLMLVIQLVFMKWEEHALTGQVTADTTRVEVTDTLPSYKPVAKDSVVVRYVTKVVAVRPCGKAQGTEAEAMPQRTEREERSAERGERSAEQEGTGLRPKGEALGTAERGTVHGDSVVVEIPITQKKYETEAYRAYVSGYEPSLDSIFVYQKTVTERVVVTQQAKQQRIGVGVVGGFGYGVTSRKPDVFVGLGLYWRL